MSPSPIRRFLSAVLLAPVLSRLTYGQQQIPKSESYTINSASSYGFLRDCAVCCFYRNLAREPYCLTQSNILTNAVGCTLNSCLCSRSDISTAALEHISSCVSFSCSGAGGDISVGQKIFNEYCDSYLGVTDAGPVTGVGDGDGSTRGPALGTVTKTETVPLVTVTATLQTATVGSVTTITSFIGTNLADNQSGATATVTATAAGGLKTSDKIGLGVGLGIGLPVLALAVVFAYVWARQHFAAYPPDIPPHTDQISGYT